MISIYGRTTNLLSIKWELEDNAIERMNFDTVSTYKLLIRLEKQLILLDTEITTSTMPIIFQVNLNKTNPEFTLEATIVKEDTTLNKLVIVYNESQDFDVSGQGVSCGVYSKTAKIDPEFDYTGDILLNLSVAEVADMLQTWRQFKTFYWDDTFIVNIPFEEIGVDEDVIMALPAFENLGQCPCPKQHGDFTFVQRDYPIQKCKLNAPLLSLTNGEGLGITDSIDTFFKKPQNRLNKLTDILSYVVVAIVSLNATSPKRYIYYISDVASIRVPMIGPLGLFSGPAVKIEWDELQIPSTFTNASVEYKVYRVSDSILPSWLYTTSPSVSQYYSETSVPFAIGTFPRDNTLTFASIDTNFIHEGAMIMLANSTSNYYDGLFKITDVTGSVAKIDTFDYYNNGAGTVDVYAGLMQIGSSNWYLQPELSMGAQEVYDPNSYSTPSTDFWIIDQGYFSKGTTLDKFTEFSSGAVNTTIQGGINTSLDYFDSRPSVKIRFKAPYLEEQITVKG